MAVYYLVAGVFHDALQTCTWRTGGAYGYSTWCRSELMALVEAKSSRSRGVRTIKAGPLGGPTAGLWLMLELELEAEEVCGLVQDRLMFCTAYNEWQCD